MASLVKISSRGVRSLNPINFRSPWPFVKKGENGQRKIGPFKYEKFRWPGQNREFPELSPKWHKENPEQLHGMTKTALLILADGAEEMEAVITADVLRRGGVEVKYAGLKGPGPVTCARKTVVTPDCDLKDVLSTTFDVVILPGGQPGSNTLAASDVVGRVLKAHHDAKKYVAAICAAPIALKSHGIPAATVTSHPSVRAQLEQGGYKYSEDRVVVSDLVVTSRGPGTAFEFALTLVELLVGSDKRKALIDPMLLKL